MPSARIAPAFGVLLGFSAGDNAVSSFFFRLCRELAARGHRAKALLMSGHSPRIDGPSDLDWSCWPSRRPTRLVDARFFWGELKTFRPDGIIANFACVNWMTLLGWLAGVPLRAVHYHTLSRQLALDSPPGSLRSSWLRRRKRLVYRLATHLIANSRAAAEDAAGVFGVTPAKCSVQYFGLEDPFERLAAPAAAHQHLRVACPGRLHYSKGQDVLIRALPHLAGRFPGLEVRFLGDGSERQKLGELAQQLGVAGACRFVGAVPHEQVLAELSRAMVTVVPSRSESMGLVNIESLSVGTPVVASKVGGIPEIVRDGLDGFLVEADDPLAVQTRLGQLLSNTDLCARMGRSGRARFLALFEVGERARQYADWLEVELRRRVRVRSLTA